MGFNIRKNWLLQEYKGLWVLTFVSVPQECRVLHNEARIDPGARALWGLKATLKNKISLMAESGMAPPNMHPDPLPDWFPGFMGLWQEDARQDAPEAAAEAAPAAPAAAPPAAPADDAEDPSYTALVADIFEGAEPAEVDEVLVPAV